ncbi:extracellular solute-binding protein [Caproiciproducens sp.]
MRKAKKIGAVLAAAVLLAVLAWGTSFLSRSDEAPKTGGDPITLKVWGSVPSEAGPAKVMEEFNRAFADRNLRAEYEFFPNNESGNERLDTTMLAGGNVDIYFTYTTRQLEKRAMGNMAVDLSSLIRLDHMDLEKDFGDSVSSYFINGKPYSIPTKSDQYGITLNKDAFDKAGIAVPKEWTFDEFRAIAKKLSKGEGNNRTYGMFFSTQQDISYIVTYFASRSLGGDPLYKPGGWETNFDSPVLHDAVGLVYNMMKVDRSAPTHEDTVGQKLTQESMFLTGRCAMTIGPWVIRSIKDRTTYPHSFTTAFAPYPISSRGTQVYEQGGLGDHLSICPTSQHTGAAWEFVKWYATEGVIYMTEGGRVPAYSGFAEDDVMKLLMKDADGLIDEESARKILVTPREHYSVPTTTKLLSQISGVLNGHMERIFTGEESVEDGLRAAKKEGDAWLKNSGS